MYRENFAETSTINTERDLESGTEARPMGSVCLKVHKWQIISVSCLLFAGQTAEEIPFLGKTSWTNTLVVLGAPRRSGAVIRKWAKTATLPKTFCVSDEDI